MQVAPLVFEFSICPTARGGKPHIYEVIAGNVGFAPTLSKCPPIAEVALKFTPSFARRVRFGISSPCGEYREISLIPPPTRLGYLLRYKLIPLIR